MKRLSKIFTIFMLTMTILANNVYSISTPYIVIDSNKENQISNYKDKIYELFNTKYTSNICNLNDYSKKGKNAYNIQISYNLNDIDNAKILNSYFEFEKEFNKKYKSLKYNEKIIIRYSTISRTTKNNEIVDYKEQKYKGNESHVIWKTIEDGSKIGKIPISTDTTTNEPRFIYVNIGDTLLDTNKPIFRQRNGYYIDKYGDSIKKVDKSEIENIKTLPNGVIDGYYEDTSLALTENNKVVNTDSIVKRADKINTVNLTMDDIYEVGAKRFTLEGNELFKNIDNIIKNNLSDITVRFEAVNKIIDEPREIYIDKSDNNNILIKYVDNNIEVKANDINKINIVIEEKTTDSKYIIYKYIIKADRRNGLDNLLEIILNGTYTKIYAGTNRYRTSVEVSKNTYNASNNVILVSGEPNSLVDGLTSTPLAVKLDAPILLTKKDTIPNEIIEEIERLGARNVYIIGGEGVVSKEVYAKLEGYYGKNVTRIYGKDRYETSIEVAKKVVKGNKSKVDTFVVGGYGLSDALSISSVAGKKLSPIILTKEDKLSYDSDIFIYNNSSKVYIIGGQTVVSNNVAESIVDMRIICRRLEGYNRQETNASVINEFYTQNKELYNNSGLIVSKSDNNGLIDSLSAGYLGAYIDAPVVLATSDLKDKQEDVLYKVKSLDNIVQVGYGVSSNIIEFINKLK